MSAVIALFLSAFFREKAANVFYPTIIGKLLHFPMQRSYFPYSFALFCEAVFPTKVIIRKHRSDQNSYSTHLDELQLRLIKPDITCYKHCVPIRIVAFRYRLS